jgi:hypothetical protein
MVDVVTLPGVHVKVVAVPDVASTVEVPEQIVAPGTEMVGRAATVTVAVALFVQVPLEPIIV